MTKFEEEREMVLKAQAGDEEALMWLWDKYQPLCVNISQMYKGKGLEYWEIVSCVKDGFFEAINKHDPDLGYLGRYAKHWMRHRCKEAISNLRPVKVPTLDTTTRTYKVEFFAEEHSDAKEDYRFFDREFVRELLDELCEEDRLLIEYRFDIDGKKKKWNDIVKEFGYNTVQMGRMRYQRALRRLREVYDERTNQKGKEQ